MTKPLTGYEKEIAILHAEARLDSELIEEFKGIANEYKQAIKRVRELADKFESEPLNETLSYRLAADRIFTALYFTDVKVDLL